MLVTNPTAATDGDVTSPPGAAPTTERVNWVSAIPFFLAHGVLGFIALTGVTRTALILFITLYVVRCFAITAGYHRYFSHRSYRMNRVMQFIVAAIGTTAAQKGPLWWAAHHRRHHRYSDTDGDVHSPIRGFWWSHVGWILVDTYKDTDEAAVKDLAAYPELRWLDRRHDLGPWLLGIASFLIGGWSGLVFGFFGSTVALWHITFTINSLSHTVGSRRYATPDTSRNNPALALITMGESWHNNHHHHQASARNGFFWWEIDLTWYGLKAMSSIGLVNGLRVPSQEVLARNRIRDGAFDLGMFRARHRRLATAADRPDRVPGRSPVDELALTEKRARLQRALTEVSQAADDLAAAGGRTATARAQVDGTGS